RKESETLPYSDLSMRAFIEKNFSHLRPPIYRRARSLYGLSSLLTSTPSLLKKNLKLWLRWEVVIMVQT
ncbi:mCG145673, isoform CRA_b, partial [Mus musculus]